MKPLEHYIEAKEQERRDLAALRAQVAALEKEVRVLARVIEEGGNNVFPLRNLEEEWGMHYATIRDYTKHPGWRTKKWKGTVFTTMRDVLEWYESL